MVYPASSMSLEERVAAVERRLSEIEGEKVTLDSIRKKAAASKATEKEGES